MHFLVENSLGWRGPTLALVQDCFLGHGWGGREPDGFGPGDAGRRRAAQGGARRRRAAQGGTIQYPPKLTKEDGACPTGEQSIGREFLLLKEELNFEGV